MIKYHWPGNVRQLKNVVERLVIMSKGGTMDLPHLMDHLQVRPPYNDHAIPETAEELKTSKKQLMEEQFSRIEKAFVLKALKECDGNITHAAEKVRMKRPNFYTLMKRHNIKIDSVKDVSGRHSTASR